MPSIFNGDLYAGLSGCDLDFDEVSLGEGVRLSKTYAHLMAPFSWWHSSRHLQVAITLDR